MFSLRDRAFRRGIGESVHVLGHREDIPEILAASDLVVDASYAGLGLTGSLREALAVETPVIGTDLEGHPELILEGETGLLVPPRNPDALGPGHPAHAGEPDAGEGHGPGGPQAGRGPLLHDPEDPADRGALRAALGREAAAVKARYRLLGRLLPYLRPYWPVLLRRAGCSPSLVSSAEAFIAWLVKPAMDDIFLKRDVTMLKLIPLALLGAYVTKGIGRFGQSYLMASVGERVIARIRGELYAHIQSMPLAFFASLHSAELMTRVVTDVNRLARLSSTVLVMAVRHVGTIVALLIVMFLREWLLTLIAIAVFPAGGPDHPRDRPQALQDQQADPAEDRGAERGAPGVVHRHQDREGLRARAARAGAVRPRQRPPALARPAGSPGGRDGGAGDGGARARSPSWAPSGTAATG